MARRRTSWFRSAATPVLAGLLAGLLLLLGLVAASDELHRAFHHPAKDGSTPCAICLLAKGQMNSADAAPVRAVCVPTLFFTVPLADSAVLPDCTYLASLGRAPPASAAPLLVVA